jgi:YVTN family beta-propeller protein
MMLCVNCGGGSGGANAVINPSSPDNGILQGRILDESNWGIKDVTVKLDPGNYSSITDKDGFFSFSVPENRYKLTITYNQETFHPSENIEVKKDSPCCVNINFSPLEGFIISNPLIGLAYIKNISSIDLEQIGYSPLSGAKINIPGSSKSLTTDSRGYFKYNRVICGIQAIEVSYEDKSIKEDIVVTSNKNITDLVQTSVIPENVSVLLGSVRQFTAYGINNRSEFVLPADVNWNFSDNPDNIGTINSDGVFVAQKTGRAELTGSFGGHTVRANIIVTSGTGSIKGRVTDEKTGQPVSSVIVSVSGINIFDITDNKGDFFLSGIPSNLNILLSVSDGINLLASKTVYVLADSTVTSDIAINSDNPSSPTPSQGVTKHPVNNSVLTVFEVERSPKGIVLTNDGLKGYIATEEGISFFSTATNKLQGLIQTGTSPRKISVSPDGLKAYVTNNGTDGLKVAVIDIYTSSLTDSLTVPKYPFDIQCSPDGKKLYITNEDQTESFVYVMDRSTKSVISTIKVDKIPHGLDISPDGGKIYVTSIVTSTTPNDIISVIDTENNKIIKTISVGPVPYEIAVTPDGKKAYVTNSGGNSVSVIDTSSNSVISTIPVVNAPLSVEVTPDGLRAFVTHFDDHVSVIDTVADTVLTTIHLSGTVGEDVTFSPDGKKAYVTTSGGGGLVHVIY